MRVHCETMVAMSESVTRGPAPSSPEAFSASAVSLEPEVMALICVFSSISLSLSCKAHAQLSHALLVAVTCS